MQLEQLQTNGLYMDVLNEQFKHNRLYEMQRGIFKINCKTKVAVTIGFDFTVLMRVRRDYNTY